MVFRLRMTATKYPRAIILQIISRYPNRNWSVLKFPQNAITISFLNLIKRCNLISSSFHLALPGMKSLLISIRVFEAQGDSFHLHIGVSSIKMSAFAAKGKSKVRTIYDLLDGQLSIKGILLNGKSCRYSIYRTKGVTSSTNTLIVYLTTIECPVYKQVAIHEFFVLTIKVICFSQLQGSVGFIVNVLYKEGLKISSFRACCSTDLEIRRGDNGQINLIYCTSTISNSFPWSSFVSFISHCILGSVICILLFRKTMSNTLRIIIRLIRSHVYTNKLASIQIKKDIGPHNISFIRIMIVTIDLLQVYLYQVLSILFFSCGNVGFAVFLFVLLDGQSVVLDWLWIGGVGRM